jgi:DNA-binding CsgD family transcriptional regulator
MSEPHEALPAQGSIDLRLAHRDPVVGLVRDGGELAALAERFYQGVFAMSAAATACVAVLVGVLFAPLEPAHLRLVTAGAAAVDALLAGLVFRHRRRIYACLRARPAGLLIIASVAGLVLGVGDPRAGPLIFPTTATLGLSAAAADLGWTIACAGILGIAQLVGDQVWGAPIFRLTNATAANQIIAAVSYLAWALVAAVVVDRLARFVLRLNRAVASHRGEPTLRVAAIVGDEPAAECPLPLALPPPAQEEGAGPPLESDVSRRLTARQLQVAVLLRDGLRYEQIASSLAVTERTVRRHAADAIKRLGVANVRELVAVLVAAAIVPSPAIGDSSAASVEAES